MRRIAVTGVAGFIGSNFALGALQAGDRVIGVDNFDPFYGPEQKEENVAELERTGDFLLVRGDVRDPATWSALAAAGPIDAVVHLAGHSDVGRSIAIPVDYFDVNLLGTVRALEFCRAHGVARFVLASSCVVYGEDAAVPLSEKDPATRPLSPYAASKRAAELACHTWQELHGIQTTALRFFSVYGPRQRPEMAIPKFTRRILADEPIPLLGRGEMVRDFTYVADAVQAIELALQRTGPAAAYNIGSSGPVTTRALVAALEKALGRNARVEELPVRAGDLAVSYASIEAARETLGYEPKVPLAAGIARFVNWYRPRVEQILAPRGPETS